MFLDVILNILSSGLPCVLLALGIFLTYRLLDFADLTAEGSFLIGAAVTAALVVKGVNPWLATFISVIAGFVCGMITGILNRYLKIPKLLSGIITLTASASIAMLIMGFANGTTFASQVSFTDIQPGGQTQTIYTLFYPWKYIEGVDRYIVVNPWGDVIKVAVMLVVVLLAMFIIYFFFGTEYGMAIRATGMNEKMAKSQGINVDIATITCVCVANALIALGGSLYVQEAKTVSTISATGYLVIGLAAILIGEAIFGKRSFKIWLIAVAMGSIFYFIIITIATRLGFPTQLKSLLYAILITIALCIPIIKEVVRNLKKKKAETNDSI